MSFKKGDRVVIVAAGESFKTPKENAEAHARNVGRAGVIVGEAPAGMWSIDLDDGRRDYWARPTSIRPE